MPKGLLWIVYSTGMRSCRYFVLWLRSSVTRIEIQVVRKVDRCGYGNEAILPLELVAGFGELMWWNEVMRFERRILLVFVMYVSSSFLWLDVRWEAFVVRFN